MIMYHMNKNTGRVNCRARKGNCPLGDTHHSTNKEEVKKAYEKELHDEANKKDTIFKKIAKNTDTRTPVKRKPNNPAKSKQKKEKSLHMITVLLKNRGKWFMRIWTS